MQKVGYVFGIISIALALFAYFPSSIPGAMSIIGFLLGFVSILLSLFSTGRTLLFFWTTVAIFLFEMVFFNDLLRLIDVQVEMPLSYKAGAYLILFLILALLYLIARWLNHRKK